MATQMKVPFGFDSGGGIAVERSPTRIDRMNLLTLLNTQPGERAMRPSYGVATRALLFAAADGMTAQLLTTEIEGVVSTYAPEIKLRDVRIEPMTLNDIQEGRVEIALDYAPAAGRLATGVDRLTTTVAVGG